MKPQELRQPENKDSIEKEILEILPQSWLHHPRPPPCAPHLERRQRHNRWPESFIGEWKLTTSVILVSVLNLTGLAVINNKPYDTFINPNRYARPPHYPINRVFDRIKVKLIKTSERYWLGGGGLLVRAQSWISSWDHGSLCAQVPYEGLMQPRGFGVAAQVMMSVERGQVYFGKCHTSDLISPLHETHIWLLLAWPLPMPLTLSRKGNNILLHFTVALGPYIICLPISKSLNRTKTRGSSCSQLSYVMQKLALVWQKMVAPPTKTGRAITPVNILCFAMIKVIY